MNEFGFTLKIKGAEQLARNPRHQSRTKHFDICFHHLGKVVQSDAVELVHIESAGNAADGLTKSLKAANSTISWR
jgi:hypothetical protein